MKRFAISVEVGMVFDELLESDDVETTQEIEARMKQYVENLLFRAVGGNNLAINVDVTAKIVEPPTQVGRPAPQDGL